MDKTAVMLLLNKDWKGLKLLGEQLRHRIDVLEGKKCPHCDGRNVEVADDGGVCYDCEKTFDLED